MRCRKALHVASLLTLNAVFLIALLFIGGQWAICNERRGAAESLRQTSRPQRTLASLERHTGFLNNPNGCLRYRLHWPDAE
jgi:hypothetical protein